MKYHVPKLQGEIKWFRGFTCVIPTVTEKHGNVFQAIGAKNPDGNCGDYEKKMLCNECEFYINYGYGREKCRERHAVADAPITPPSDIPKVRNANHDCKDYEKKK